MLDIAIKKIRKNIKEIGPCAVEYPVSKDGKYFSEKPRELRHIYSWMQGFYTGLAGISYFLTKEDVFLKWLYSLQTQFYDKVNKYRYDTMHDLGFTFSLYAVMMYKITGDEKMKNIGIDAANCLAMRFVPNGKYIRAWGRMDGTIPDYVDSKLAGDMFFSNSDGLMIIDTMMNLPLLFWATEVTGHPFYKDIAIAHIETAVKNLVRKDYSVYHAYRFNIATGDPICPENDCGFSVESYWARGASWMIYGLAIAYKYTKNEEYLELFENLTENFIYNCNVDGIPVWDFRLPEGEEMNLDTSAAAIVCCAILCYKNFKTNSSFNEYLERAMMSLNDNYFDPSENINGLLKHGDGTEVYTIFGDYYFIEAFAVKEKGMEIFW